MKYSKIGTITRACFSIRYNPKLDAQILRKKFNPNQREETMSKEAEFRKMQRLKKKMDINMNPPPPPAGAGTAAAAAAKIKLSVSSTFRSKKLDTGSSAAAAANNNNLAKKTTTAAPP